MRRQFQFIQENFQILNGKLCHFRNVFPTDGNCQSFFFQTLAAAGLTVNQAVSGVYVFICGKLHTPGIFINPCADFCDYVKRVEVIAGGVDEKLVENANRVLRILKEDAGEVRPELFVQNAEKDLYQAVQAISFNGDYAKYLTNLTEINPVVTKFFDDVLVMDKDENIKNNRLALLKSLKNKYIILTDFSQM